MRIKKIWISKYKNVENLNLNFSKNDFSITILVGQNGLGKSNLIEILTLIFRDLDLIEDTKDFESWPDRANHFEFDLTYNCRNVDIRIICKKNSFQIFKRTGNGAFEKLDHSTFWKEKDSHLPKYIVGYYSGENKRIKSIIKPHQDLEIRFLKNWQKKKKSRKNEKEGLRRLFFAENRHSQMVLLTMALYVNSGKINPLAKDIMYKYLRIDNFLHFTIRFQSPEWFKVGGNLGIEYLIANINDSDSDIDEYESPFWGLKGSLDELLTRFYNHQIDTKEPLLYVDKIEGRNREIIEFNDIDIDKFANQLIERFPDPLDFLYSLEALDLAGGLESIRFKIRKQGVEQPFDYDELSEGEQQLLAILGLMLIIGKDESLFLLDEPDTHLNPIWQRDFVDLLEKLRNPNRHVIVATHSPLLVQSSDKASVVLFHQGRKRISAQLSVIPFHTWRLDHVVTSKYFGFESARPKDDRLDRFMKIREHLLSRKKRLTARDEKLLEEYKDDFGLFPTGETFSDMKAMSFIRSEANEYD